MPRWLAVAPLTAMLALAVPAAAEGRPDEIERAFSRLYNFDFQGAYRILDGYTAAHPAEPLPYAVRAATDLFYELDRLGILEAEFFTDDRRIAEKKKLKPDPAVRQRFFRAIEEARSRASVILAAKPEDANALFATCMTYGMAMDYAALVEKRQLGSLSLGKRANACAAHLLKLHPDVYDAHVSTGSTEYLFGSLPFYVRWFVRFDDVKGNKQQGIRDLALVARSGHYLKPFAKVLLAICYLREKRPHETEKLLAELSRDYPENPLYRRELAKLASRMHGGSTSAP